MSRQIDRLEDLYVDSRAAGIKNQRRIAEAGTPASIYKRSIDSALHPAALEPVELMMVRATRCQGSVGDQAVPACVRGSPGVSFAVSAHAHEPRPAPLGTGRSSGWTPPWGTTLRP